HGGEEDDESERLNEEVGTVLLKEHYLIEIERPGDHGNGQETDDQGYFVADHLGDGADTAKEGVFAAGAKPGHENADDVEPKNGEDEEEAERHVPHAPVLGEGQRHQDGEDGDEGGEGGEFEDP